MSLTPHIVVPDAAAAADFYRRAFGAEEVGRVPLPRGRVMSVELLLGGTSLHVGSEFSDFGILSPMAIGGTATVLQLDVPDADAAWARALEAGAEVRSPLADQFWGERHGQVVDPFGHRWNIAQRVREVPPEEIAERAAEVFGSG
ncbi:MAG: VOC family protein [Thermoleophilaceae bacterium]